MASPSAQRILSEYRVLREREANIWRSYAYRCDSASAGPKGSQKWPLSRMDRRIAHELRAQSHGLVDQLAETEEIFRRQTGSKHLEELFSKTGMARAAQDEIVRCASWIMEYHDRLQTALEPGALPAPQTGTSSQPPLPSAEKMSEILATVDSRADSIGKDCTELEARLRQHSTVAMYFAKQMDGLEAEFGFTGLAWRANLLGLLYPGRSSLDVPNQSMSQLLRASGYGRLIVKQYNRTQKGVAATAKRVRKTLEQGKTRGV